MKRLLLIVAALLACGLIAAGCGDDDDDNGSDSPAAAETTPTDTTGDVGSVEDAVEACKDGVEQTAGELSEDLRNDLEQLCEDAAAGDEEEIREASIDICRRVAEEVVPEGPGRDQALEACESAGGPQP
jgi:hypothetical protein